MKFWEFYRTLIRRKKMVIGLVAVTVAAIYAFTIQSKPYYQASVKLMPSDAALYRPILPSVQPNVNGDPGQRETDSQLPNLMALLKSKEVAERTVRAAGIKVDPEKLRDRLDVGIVPNPGAENRKQAGTDLIQIQVRDSNPERAIHAANTLAHVFSSFYQEISHQEASDNRRFLESEIVRAKMELDSTAERLRSFKQTNRLTTAIESTTAAEADSRRAAGERDGARAELAEAQAKLYEIDRQLRSIGPTREVEEGTSNTIMAQQLDAQLADLTKQLNDAKSKYEDAHPQVVAIQDAIAQVQAKLADEKGNIKKNVEIIRNPVYEALLQERAKAAYERDGLAAKAAQLEASVARTSGEFKPGADVSLTQLENEFLSAQTAFTNLQTQLHQARISEKETTGTGAIRVVDRANDAEGPIGQNRGAFLVLGVILSLMVGMGLAITMESLDNRIKTTVDVEELLGLPVTSLIPSCTDSPNNGLARITYTDPLSPLSEAYRFLRTDLLLSSQITGAKTIMVATAKPGQGGTSTVANLGISLAQDGKRVVLVDADMRRPCLHRIFKAENDIGLSNALTNEKDFQEVVISTEIDNLLLIPAGPTPSNPSELLGSGRMRSLVHWLSEYADFVLFDTPSAIAFTDSVVLSQVVDGVILVVRAQQVPRGAELQVRNLLNKANANILGVVLNDVEPESVDSYYYHSHYYPDARTRKQRQMPNAAPTRSLPSTEQSTEQQS